MFRETSIFKTFFIFVLIHRCRGVRDVSINVRVTRTLRHVVFPANQNPCVAVLTNQRPGEVLTHLIVTENCIWLFLRQKVSSQTSSRCCHCHCGILNKHRHLDKFDIIKEPRDDLSVQPPLLFLETLHTWDVTDCLFLIFLFRHLLHKLQNLKIKQN